MLQHKMKLWLRVGTDTADGCECDYYWWILCFLFLIMVYVVLLFVHLLSIELERMWKELAVA
jgi:hypothetical protein